MVYTRVCDVCADCQRGHSKVKRLVKFATIFILIVAGGYAACAFIAPTYYVRYRLTLEVDVRGVMHRGEGVVEISYQLLPEKLTAGFGGAHFQGVMRGYAITVDLGGGNLLYVVNADPSLRSGGAHQRPLYPNAESMGSLPLIAFGLPGYGTSSAMEPVILELQRQARSVEVDLDKLPMLVHFRASDGQGPAYEVDPGDLSKSFGEGVRISRATLELTSQSITSMPQIWPAWLMAAARDQQISLRADDNRLIVFYGNISVSQFKGD